jgi:hypothetical protein
MPSPIQLIRQRRRPRVVIRRRYWTRAWFWWTGAFLFALMAWFVVFSLWLVYVMVWAMVEGVRWVATRPGSGARQVEGENG